MRGSKGEGSMEGRGSERVKGRGKYGREGECEGKERSGTERRGEEKVGLVTFFLHSLTTLAVYLFCDGVQGRGSFIIHKNWCVLQNSSSYCHSLLLSSCGVTHT